MTVDTGATFPLMGACCGRSWRKSTSAVNDQKVVPEVPTTDWKVSLGTPRRHASESAASEQSSADAKLSYIACPAEASIHCRCWIAPDSAQTPEINPSE